MEIEHPYSLGARWIHTMLAAPLENHWINIAEGKVESISKKPVHVSTKHLGERSEILPAGINAHAHLELSQLESPLDIPSRAMSDWIAALLAFRRSAHYDATQGIRQALCRPELLESTVVVADIVPPTLTESQFNICDSVSKTLPIKYFSFAELIAWQSDTAKKIAFPSNVFGLSPHAPHTVCPTLLERTIDQKLPIAMHLAETLEELQLLRHHRALYSK